MKTTHANLNKPTCSATSSSTATTNNKAQQQSLNDQDEDWNLLAGLMLDYIKSDLNLDICFLKQEIKESFFEYKKLNDQISLINNVRIMNVNNLNEFIKIVLNNTNNDVSLMVTLHKNIFNIIINENENLINEGRFKNLCDKFDCLESNTQQKEWIKIKLFICPSGHVVASAQLEGKYSLTSRINIIINKSFFKRNDEKLKSFVIEVEDEINDLLDDRYDYLNDYYDDIEPQEVDPKCWRDEESSNYDDTELTETPLAVGSFDEEFWDNDIKLDGKFYTPDQQFEDADHLSLIKNFNDMKISNLSASTSTTPTTIDPNYNSSHQAALRKTFKVKLRRTHKFLKRQFRLTSKYDETQFSFDL